MAYPTSKIQAILLYSIICLFHFIHPAKHAGHHLTTRREPNNVQCFKNSDCLSDCCISNNGWVGICVGKPQIGQICGLFTTANSAPGGGGGAGGGNGPWNNWNYGAMMNGMLVNPGGPSAPAAGAQPSPSARQGNGGRGGPWMTDLNTLFTANQPGSSGRDQYDTAGLLQALQQGAGGRDYGGMNGGYGRGNVQQGAGFNMNNFDLSSLKYGNKFGKRSSDKFHGK